MHKRYPSRLFRIHCDPALPGIVEVRIARTRWQMHEEIIGWSPPKEPVPHPETMGQLTSYVYLRGVKKNVGKMRPNAVVGRMFLNRQDLGRRPTEIVSHECAHVGMAWVRLRRANLERMPGEEVLCHAVGRLTRQVIDVCYAAGAFRG